MGAFTPDTFTAEQATKFMNPYLAAALAPQLAEARRQSQISLFADRSGLTKAKERLVVVDKQLWMS